MIGLRPGLQAFRQAPPGAGTIRVATFGELPDAATVPPDSVGIVGDDENTSIYISDGADWIAQRVLVDSDGSLPSDAAEGAMALVGTSTPLLTRTPRVYQSSAWRRPGPSIRVITDIFDFAPDDQDGDIGVLVLADGPMLLRLKLNCTVAVGGTLPVWMTADAWESTPILRMWATGTESNEQLLDQGWTIVPDNVSCTVTPTSGMQRLTVPAAAVSVRLRGMLAGLSASTKVESLFQARASTAANATQALPYVLIDGVNGTAFGQASGSGVGFKDFLFGGPLQLPTRNGTTPSMPTLAQTPATFLVRDEGRTILASAMRDGAQLGNYRRNLIANAANLFQVSVQGSVSGTATLDYRGTVITHL